MSGRGAEEGAPPRSTAAAAGAAGADAGTAETDTERELLTLRLGKARFGLWIDEVLEILRTPPISRLPLAAREVAGVVSVRGDVVPVLDLGQRLLAEPARRPGRIVLVRHRESESVVALLVDAVETLLRVSPDEVRPAPPEAEADMPPGFVTGIVSEADAVITVLDIGAAAAPPEQSEEED